MEITAVIVGLVVLSAVMFKIGYSYGKKNLLIHLIQKKIITSEKYTELEEEDI